MLPAECCSFFHFMLLKPVRRFRYLVISFVLLSLTVILCDVKGLGKFAVYYSACLFPQSVIGLEDIPPSYTTLRKWEQELPQHDLDLPSPEGRTGRYVLFTSSKVDLMGWNNKFVTVLMDCLLAYKSNRSYVFYDFAWPDKHYSWPIHKYREWTPHTPLNALISGPTAGGSWDPEDPAPRAVSEKWFDVVCPKSERRYINTHDVKPFIYWEEGDVIFEHWRKLLSDAPERCIEVIPPPPEQDGYPQIFDLYLWGSSRSLSLWEDLKNSPISRLLTASPIVRSAIENNLPLFMPAQAQEQLATGFTPESSPPFDQMLSVHLRRGDYERQCRHFWKWSSTFYSWNLLPFLPDRFDPPAGFTWGNNLPENLPVFLERCFPEIPAIIKRIQDVKRDYVSAASVSGEERSLDVLYIMTNDHTVWLDNLKRALMREGWETIVTSSDLVLDGEQKDVGVAVDMEIGRRSAVFVGNGWSSFTSNVVHQRLVDGRVNGSIRFL